MTSPLEEVTEPKGASSPGAGDTEGQVPGRAPAPSPRESLTSEDLDTKMRNLCFIQSISDTGYGQNKITEIEA